ISEVTHCEVAALEHLVDLVDRLARSKDDLLTTLQTSRCALHERFKADARYHLLFGFVKDEHSRMVSVLDPRHFEPAQQISPHNTNRVARRSNSEVDAFVARPIGVRVY